MSGRHLLRLGIGSLAFVGSDRASEGQIQVVAGASLVDGDFFTILDGVGQSAVFEFDNNAVLGIGDIGITFAGGETAAQIAVLVAQAIDVFRQTRGGRVRPLIDPLTPTRVRVVHEVFGDVGASLTENVANAGFAVIDFDAGRAFPGWLNIAQRSLIDHRGAAQALPQGIGPMAAVQGRP